MSTYGKGEKVCATCIYWKGPRGVEFEFIETREEQGKCNCEEGFYNIRTTDTSCCSDWIGFSCDNS